MSNGVMFHAGPGNPAMPDKAIGRVVTCCLGGCGVLLGIIGIIGIGIGAAGLAGHLSLQAASISSIVMGIFNVNLPSLILGILGIGSVGVVTNVSLISGFVLGGGIIFTLLGCCTGSCSSSAAALYDSP